MAKENKKELIGKVISDKMLKTIVVEVVDRELHPIYHKYLIRTNKFKAHDEKGEAKIGDTVKILESRPISKDKKWRLLKILEKAR